MTATSSTLRTIDTDVAIIGAGVAGLWAACALARSGRHVTLIERHALGAGQTLGSQGIIHGGVKYALTGAAASASRAIAQMPERWSACLAGTGEIDLTSTRVLSDRQWLWSTGSLASRFTALAASKAIRTSVQRVTDRAHLCPGLRSAPPGVDLYEVPEPVLDPRTLVLALANQARALGVRTLRATVSRHDQGLLLHAPGADEPVRLRARAAILAGAQANADLAPDARQQVRPLHMVMAQGDLPPLWGHCVAGLSDKPRITIGWQPGEDGRGVWYLGGQIAETGIARTPLQQIEHTRAELCATVPWLALDNLQWATCRWNRAEGLTPDGTRPDEPVLSPVQAPPGVGAMLALWPTKLAFAPLVGDLVTDWLARQAAAGVPPFSDDAPAPAGDWSEPPLGNLPWVGAEWTTR